MKRIVRKKNQSELNDALIKACEKNSYQGVVDALNAGANIFAKNNKDESAWSLVKNEINSGAKKALESSVYLADEAWWGRKDKVKELLKNNKFSETALTKALMEAANRYDNASDFVKGNHEKICELLLESGANPHFSFDEKSNTTAHSTAQNGSSDSMKSIFNNYDKKVEKLKDSETKEKRSNKKRKNSNLNGNLDLLLNFIIRFVKRIFKLLGIIKIEFKKDTKGKNSKPKGKKVSPEFTKPVNSLRKKRRENKRKGRATTNTISDLKILKKCFRI